MKNKEYFDNFHFTVGFSHSGYIELEDHNHRIKVKKGSHHATEDNRNKAIDKIEKELSEDHGKLDGFNYIYRGCDRQFINNGKFENTGFSSKTTNSSS